MAIVEIPGGGIFAPAPIAWSEAGVPTFETYTLDTTTRKFAIIFRVPESNTLDKFEFGLRTVTQAPANGLKVSFQDVVGGEPDGTATHFRVVTSGLTTISWVSPDAITDDGTDTGNKKVAVRGDLVACVIEFESFSFGDDLDIAVLAGSQYTIKGAYILSANLLGVWTKGTGIPCMGLVVTDYEVVDVDISDGHIAVPNTYPVYDIIADAAEFEEEAGMVFHFPAPVRIGGGYVFVSPLVDFEVVLYDVEDEYREVERVSISLDDYLANGNNQDYVEFRFLSDHLIDANKPYILAIATQDISDVVDFAYLWSSNIHTALGFPFGGTWYASSHKEAGVWAGEGVANLLPLFGLLVTGIDHEIGGNSQSGWEGNP